MTATEFLKALGEIRAAITNLTRRVERLEEQRAA